ncbi:reverse transcriptase, putative [Ixodes scapularis]|uniref:Reverse transcriptase, putative n=1 Tax=Ixodes scapularis TaxID=6945 RepID=B7P3R3_IXOSC|nr:reverse transcriptase, putative [Ixodes scapularis]|eukprot:XP_002404572.1 reverse transcriptase, putative [Ixodes scapularis]
MATYHQGQPKRRACQKERPGTEPGSTQTGRDGESKARKRRSFSFRGHTEQFNEQYGTAFANSPPTSGEQLKRT